MDTVLARRNLANENNTAQLHIDNRIQWLAKTARRRNGAPTTFFLDHPPLQGPINLHALAELNVDTVLLNRGQVTDVQAIPPTVVNFEMHHQLLVELPAFPVHIERIDLDHNFIEEIDLAKYQRLKVLRLNNNRLRAIDHLPASLEELHVHQNQLQSLDLRGLSRLRVLDCTDNRMLRVENIPASLTDLRADHGNPRIALDFAFLPNTKDHQPLLERPDAGSEADFVEAMRLYFTFKTEYETNYRALRDAALEKQLARSGVTELSRAAKRRVVSKLRPLCVNCDRPGGTFFRSLNQRLLAYCGVANDPCPFQIEIYRGEYAHDDHYLEDIEKELDEIKETVIDLKMRMLFGYVDEADIVAPFQGLLAEFDTFQFMSKSLTEQREDKRFNQHRKELVKAKRVALQDLRAAMDVYMDEYRRTRNREALRTAMDTYVRQYAQEVAALRMLEHSTMEMVTEQGGFDPAVAEPSVLRQSVSTLRDAETLQSEIPRVLKLRVGADAAMPKIKLEPLHVPAVMPSVGASAFPSAFPANNNNNDNNVAFPEENAEPAALSVKIPVPFQRSNEPEETQEPPPPQENEPYRVGGTAP